MNLPRMESTSAVEKKADFIKNYGSPQLIVRAPGRVNIIGEHIDYCEGWVLPFAIEQSMYFFCQKLKTDNSEFLNLDTGEEYIQKELHHIASCIQVLNSQGFKTPTVRLGITSEIPIGGGLSSSSALCCGFISCMNQLFEYGMSKDKIIQLASLAEYGLGVQGGLMDQHTIMFAQEGKAVFLDCLSNRIEHIEISNKGYHFELIDTGVKHKLADSDYGKRKKELYEGMEQLRSKYKESLSFRELDAIHIEDITSPNQAKRMRHVLTESKRVHAARNLILKNRPPKELGMILNESHASLRDDYEVSCAEADWIVQKLSELKMSYGSRIVGGGFGGHVISLRSGYSLEQRKKFQESFYRAFGQHAAFRPVKASSGLSIIRT